MTPEEAKSFLLDTISWVKNNPNQRMVVLAVNTLVAEYDRLVAELGSALGPTKGRGGKDEP